MQQQQQQQQQQQKVWEGKEENLCFTVSRFSCLRRAAALLAHHLWW
jgi:hypothetical protein